MDSYNIQPAEIDIYCRKGDRLLMSFAVQLNSEDYSLEGKELKLTIRDFEGNVKHTFSSEGDSPALSMTTNIWSVSYSDGLNFIGSYKYDLQVDGSDTIQSGKWIVEKEYTE